MTTSADAEKVSEYPYFNDPGIINDPYEGYGRLREQAPVVPVRMPDDTALWLITRFDDVRAFLKSPKFVNELENVPGGAPQTRIGFLKQQGVDDHLFPYLADSIGDLDPPRHTRLRKGIARAFTRARVHAMRPRMEALINEALDALPDHADDDGSVDLIEHFAKPMPVGIICELVGVPLEDLPQWGMWARELMSYDPERLPVAAREAIEYLHGLADRRRAEAADDLISAMVHAPNDNGERLTDVEIVGMVLALVVGGYENTANLVSNSTVGLLTHRDQLALLRDDPSLIPDAMHEFQRRYAPSIRTRMRYVSEELELAGHRFRVGDQVSGVLVSANHDPRKFPDPDRLDVTRFQGQGEQHLSFGHGVHYCIGAALGLNEAEIAFTRLLARYPDLALAVPAEELPWIPAPGWRRMDRLPVRLGRGV